MNDGGPYRALPKFLLCPRCGEQLDRAFDDVLACMRCQGIFVTPPTAGLAFDDPAWPSAASAMWWKSALECPVCAYDGAVTVMAAQVCEGTQIDRCATHGLWLDQGELSRLLRTSGDELSELRRRLTGDEDVAALDAKREAWRNDVDARRRAAEAHNEWLATRRAREIAEADRKLAAERAAAEEQKKVTEALSGASRTASKDLFDPPAAVVSPTPNRSPTWREQQELVLRREAEREQVDAKREIVMRAIGELEQQLANLRLAVRDVESKLATERTKLRVLIAG